MLSSPLTQAVNIFGNAQNVALVAPIEKTLRGVIDATGGLFGKERKFATGEGAAYAGGVASNVSNASKSFVDALRGTGRYANPDLEPYSMPLATSGAKGAAYKTLSAPMRVLDGMDKFFRTLAEGGEDAALSLRQKKGIKVNGDRSLLKKAEADYRVFQTELGEAGQGIVDDAFDEFAKLVMRGRNSKNPIFSTVSKFTVPFVKTVNNIAKQGIVDYSPVGFVNLKGNADKTTALTRAIMGSAVFGTSAALVASGQMTWAEPRDADERARFRAEGKQPYAIKIGGKWFNFSKLTPSVAFPMAMTAALDDAVKNKQLDQGNVDAILEAVSKYGNFLSDQSYAKSVGDTLGALGGDKEAVAQAVSNNVQQVVPFRAFTGWIARMSDDKERKVDTSQGYFDQQVESLMQQYPQLRQKTGTRDYKGEPIAANNQVLNAFSPVRVTDDRGTDPLDAEMDNIKASATEAFALDKRQKKELDSITAPEVTKMQKDLIKDPRYQELSVDERKKVLQKAKNDITGSRKAEYMAKNNIGPWDPNYSGKEFKLSKNEKRLAKGEAVDFLSNDTDKTFAEKYDDAVSNYSKDSKDWSPVERAKKQKEIDQLKIKKDFDNDTVSMYGMGKADLYELINSDKNGKDMAKKVLAYGDALVAAGLAKSNKFRDKYGDEDFIAAGTKAAAKSGTGKSKTTTGSSRSGGRGRTNFDLYTSTGANPLSFEKSLRKLIQEARLSK
jgi:hypothetical protein